MSNSIASFVNSQSAVAAAAAGPHTYIGFLIDKSGSMFPYVDAVTDGVNQFISKISSFGGKRPGDFILSEFSSDYTQVLNKAFSKVSKTFNYNFQPESITCLYDSVVRIVKDVEAKIAGSGGKKSKIIIPIMTDGQDSGCSVTAQEVKQLVESKTGQGWEFMLLGADLETPEIADQIGIKQDLAVTFDPSNMKEAIGFVGKKVTQFMQGKVLKVTQEERLLLEGSPRGKTEL
ncbi:MAG: hypothetical protein S4CHLAM6_02640 [Chlamydiae bacterium]|nr:hypothetical protein [Chlamydiota bacterium]